MPIVGHPTITESVNGLLPLVDEYLKGGKTDSPNGGDQSAKAAIIFMGDVMLGRSVAARISENGDGYPFAKIKEAVSAADCAIANLEGPLTKTNNEPQNRMRFHFDPRLAPVLAAAGFDAFSLANNHGLDQGGKGETDTKNNLESAGLKYFGDVSSDNGPILHFDAAGVKFAVIGLHDVYRRIDPAAVSEKIAELRKAGEHVIVYPHWGDEYEHKANARQTELAHAFIDAGADMVIGGHPHVVEGVEEYNGGIIFYSLGNLIFDQYFSADTQEGLALRLIVGAAGIEKIELLPYEIPQSQPGFVDGEKKGKMLKDIASWSDMGLKGQIEAGVLEINSSP